MKPWSEAKTLAMKRPKKDCKAGGHATRCVDDSGYCSGCRANRRKNAELSLSSSEALLKRIEALEALASIKQLVAKGGAG